MTASAIQPFDPNGFPLEPGIQLLEASAGTGKTFALAHLVLRLVTRPKDPLRLEQLLVVTFTEAAAAELRDRIAERLQRALAVLEQDHSRWPSHPDLTHDDPLRIWRAQQPDATGPVRGQLLVALEDLDRADITTIHGFCRRSLQRQALEAGLGPAVQLESEANGRIQQISHDYWQQQVLPLEPDLLAGLQQRGLAPTVLTAMLGRLDGDPALGLEPLPTDLDLDRPLATQLSQHWPHLWERFRQAWDTGGVALEESFKAVCGELKAAGHKTTPYAAKPRTDRVALVDQWIRAQEAPPSYRAVLDLRNSASGAQQPEALLVDYFHPGTWMKVTEPLGWGDSPLPQRPLLEAVAALVDGPAERTLLHFAHWGRRELARRRRRSGCMGFSQLLEGLDPGAWDRGVNGNATNPEGHETLISALAQRYRVALIDEFQDTDPIQWRILERAFTPAAGAQPRHLLVMVGDPKQAIYRFRGGELATYRKARIRAQGIHSLTQNRRSSKALVSCLNGLMVERGLVQSGLPVPQVEACATKGELSLGPEEAPLQLLPLDPDQLAPQVAALCLHLLERGLSLRHQGAERPLEPADLCLLVGRHQQADELRQALEHRGLPSRLVSKGDVFASEGATALQRLLDALADPGNANRLRLLAASPLLGWSAAEIAATTPEAWDALADRIARLGQALGRQGPMAALGQLLRMEGIARLSLQGRALADIQQAAELVQEQMHRQALGAAAAADWLRRLRLDPDRDPPESHQPRSDAAESAIAVVTVHRSKGLEYPVVICPYLWMAAPQGRGGVQGLGKRWTPPGSDEPRLDLHLNPHWGRGRLAALEHQQAQVEEGERLAYVACTRARHLLVLGWHNDPRHSGNPLAAWLLDPGGQPRELNLEQLEPARFPAAGARWTPPHPSGVLACGPRPRHGLDNRWGRASYSSWAHSASAISPQAREEGRDTDALVEEGDTTAQTKAWARQGPLARFPRGAGPGEALHRILERIDYRQPSDHPDSRAVASAELERAGLDAALLPDLLEGLELVRLTPMGGALGGFRLADLAPEQRLNEMNFDLPLAVPRQHGLGAGSPAAMGTTCVTAAGLAQVFADHPGGLFGERYAARLGQLQVNSRGFLTGSIDLVFHHQGRWWISDWKSNWLGERDGDRNPIACGPAHYSTEAMAALMAANHYPLQAHLYLVALHRYLRWRLAGYCPEEHLGGYAYVFLRGTPGPTSAGEVPGMLVEQPPLGRVLALDACLREGRR